MATGTSTRPVGQNEFAVRVPKPNDSKKYSVIKFNGNLGIDVASWSNAGCNVRLQREDNEAVATFDEIKQEYGAGTEFGRASREEARRKKYGRQTKTYRRDDQPWTLSIETEENGGKVRRFRGMREGGAGEHADYWLFLKSGDGLFDAHKVDNWYQFLPIAAHKTLDVDEAEQQYLKRSKVLNQFALKAEIQQQIGSREVDGEKLDTKAKNLLIKDEASDSDDNGESDSEMKDGDDTKSRDEKQKKTKKMSADKRQTSREKKQRVDNADDVAAYESEDGEDEGREYDYMSDSGSESGRDDITNEEKVEKAMVAVGDETGLKNMIDSDYEDSSDDDDDDAEKLFNASGTNRSDRSKNRTELEDDERDSSDSDSDDPDKEKMDSVVFLPHKAINPPESTAKVEEQTSGMGKKRAMDNTDADAVNVVKKPKVEPSASSSNDGLTEETIRKYLRRKPHTTKELLSKIKPRCIGMSKPEIVTQLAAILKRIEPRQFKQKQGKKEVLFFSIES